MDDAKDMTQTTVLAYLGLGSNLGNRLAFMRGGRDALCALPEVELAQASSVYETAAQGGPEDSPDYLNVVIAVRTSLTPQALLAACQTVETDFGRVRTGQWMPRTLDIDLLLYDEQVVEETDLQVPHPRLHERCFVLVPFAEIAPQVWHPLRHASIAELLKHCAADQTVRLLRPTW